MAARSDTTLDRPWSRRLAWAVALAALPLLLFGGAARRLRLSTLGLLQYTVPTGHFVLAVFVFGEPFSAAHAVTFGAIWLALALYGTDLLRARPASA